MATSAPAFANSMAMALPIQVPPAVTTAVFPASENGDFSMAGQYHWGVRGAPPNSPRFTWQSSVRSIGPMAYEAHPPIPPDSRGDRACAGSVLRLPRERDFGLAARELALDAAVDAAGRERHAVVFGAGGELVQDPGRFVEAAARSLGGAADVVVAGALGLDPRLLGVSGQQQHAIDLALGVGFPGGGGREAWALAGHERFEVLDE